LLHNETIGEILDKETIARFLEKSKCDYVDETNLIENEHGFMSWKVDRDKFVCINVYGDGEY
tara:strand:+ start:547 stop:732 length:186 start_codon:yes stop_codon:yes gene_type:complete